MRVVHYSSLYEPRGIPAHATAWRLVEQPFPRAPSASPSPLRAEALHCRQADNRIPSTKASKLRLWV